MPANVTIQLAGLGSNAFAQGGASATKTISAYEKATGLTPAKGIAIGGVASLAVGALSFAFGHKAVGVGLGLAGAAALVYSNIKAREGGSSVPVSAAAWKPWDPWSAAELANMARANTEALKYAQQDTFLNVGTNPAADARRAAGIDDRQMYA